MPSRQAVLEQNPLLRHYIEGMGRAAIDDKAEEPEWPFDEWGVTGQEREEGEL